MDLTNEAEQAYTYSAKRYGVSYDSIEVECRIDKDGSAQVKRKVEVHAHSLLSDLDTFLLIPSDSPPPGDLWEIDFLKVRSLTTGQNVTLDETVEEFGRLSAILKISPPLYEGAIVTYEVVEKLPDGLYAIGYTRADLEKRPTKDDYFGWNINRPTKKLIIQVTFPHFDAPQIYSAEVRYASASGFSAVRPQYEEQKRLRPKLIGPSEDNQYTLNLEVEYPMHGLVYILRWQPPVLEKQDDDVDTMELAKSDKEVEFLRELRQILTARFNESELRLLCFDLGMDYDALPGQGRVDKVIQLITYFDRREQVAELIRVGKQQRSDISWPGLVT